MDSFLLQNQNNAGLMSGFMSPRISSPMHPSGGGGAAGGRGRGRGGGSVRRDRDLIGQIIKITRGPYKGHFTFVYSLLPF